MAGGTDHQISGGRKDDPAKDDSVKHPGPAPGDGSPTLDVEILGGPNPRRYRIRDKDGSSKLLTLAEVEDLMEISRFDAGTAAMRIEDINLPGQAYAPQLLPARSFHRVIHRRRLPPKWRQRATCR